MISKLIYIIVLLLVFSICKMIYKETPTTTIRKIYHYHIYDTKQNYDRRKEARKLLKEILYGHEYKPTIPEGLNFWWQELPSNHFHIFPGGDPTLRFQ